MANFGIIKKLIPICSSADFFCMFVNKSINISQYTLIENGLMNHPVDSVTVSIVIRPATQLILSWILYTIVGEITHDIRSNTRYFIQSLLHVYLYDQFITFYFFDIKNKKKEYT